MDKRTKREVENVVRAELAKVTTTHYMADRRTEELLNLYNQLDPTDKWRRKLDDALAKIDEHGYPLLLEMRYIKGATVEDIAGIYARSVWSIYAELRRQRHEVAKQLFASELAEEIGTLPENGTGKEH